MRRLLPLLLLLCCCDDHPEVAPQPVPPAARPTELVSTPEFSGDNAYVHCAAICALGPRYSGSPAYEQQLQYLEKHLHAAGWQTARDTFAAPNGVEMCNLRAFRSENPAPLLLSCHIDTKIKVAHDFQSADDGASGAAVLLELAPEVRDLLNQQQITVGHAKVLLQLKDNAMQTNAALRVARGTLTVRQTEQLVRDLLTPAPKVEKPAPALPEAYARVCSQLSQDFGTKVNIAMKGKNNGVIEIPYAGREDLVRILQIFGISESL